MKRPVLLLAILLSLAACSEAKEGAPEPTPAADRFQTLWTDTTDLLNGIDTKAAAPPTNADQANEAAGLDEDSPLHFADMSALPDGGRWCIESDQDTYVAMTYGDGESAILMGDGACDYDEAKAEVVGDFITAEWTHGDDLMGDVSPEPSS